MIGFEEAAERTDYDLLGARPPTTVIGLLRANWHRVVGVALVAAATTSLALLSAADLLDSQTTFAYRNDLHVNVNVNDAVSRATQWHGVSLGGWLVMEINPSKRKTDSPMDLRPGWMYDQIEASSELDFITELRKEKGDAYAIATMRNHWEYYISDAQIAAAKGLGIDTVRIPVGYWIMDAPVDGSSPYEYGISPEGFVTGGLNSLLTMLIKLKKQGMGALVDIHAMPCNSACVSNGLYCEKPLAFMAAGEAPIGDLPKCKAAGGGVYPTTRKPREGEMEWPDVAVNAVGSLAKWIKELPDEAQGTVVCFQMANEPALGPSSFEVYQAILSFYKRAQAAARMHLTDVPLVFSFMGPTPTVTTFLRETDAAERAAGNAGIIGDHHYYLNWQACCGLGPGVPALNQMPWDEIHRRACILEAEGNAHDIDVYGKNELQVIVGEWSLATNLDAAQDISKPEIRQQLTQLFREQLETFRGRSEIRGAFFWTLRMGSGWDPRPTDAHPHGRQVEGSSAWHSLEGYPFKIWSLLEMEEAGIATPLNLPYDGACAKNRCHGPLGSCEPYGHAPPPAPSPGPLPPTII